MSKTASTRRPRDDRQDGFTLIELLVVIIIIGILAAVAVPVFLNQRQKGYQASEKSDLRTVADAMENFYVERQTYKGATIGGTPPAATLGIAFEPNPQRVPLSAGNTVAITQQGDDGYCLTVTSTKSTATPYIYNSLAGGLQPASMQTCAGSF